MTNTGYLFNRNLSWDYPKIVKGKGIYLYDDNGNEYIDSCSGAAAANIGHGNEEVAEAMAEQAKKIAFQHMYYMMTQPPIDLAQIIKDMMPGDLNYTFFTDDGSSATDAAIKMARQYFLERDGISNKYKVIARWRAYHGTTMGALSVTGIPSLRRKFAPMLIDFPHIAQTYCYRCEFGKDCGSCSFECADALEREIRRQGPENVSAFIYEPVTGSSASAAYPEKGYFKRIREICDKYDILMIADEVMNGFGRTGRNFAMQHFDVVPDIIAFAKGVTAAYIPLGGITVSEKIMEAFVKDPVSNFVHGHTYTGLAVACATGCKVQEIIKRDNLVENAHKIGSYIKRRLTEELSDMPIVGDIRGLGLQIGVEFVKDKKTKEPYEARKLLTKKLIKIGYKNGISFYTGNGTADEINGDTVTLAPPLIINQEGAEEMIRRIKASIIMLSEEII